MSSSDKKILVSGCGLSWSGTHKKTWVNALKVLGHDIIDTGGPAVSNQWILDKAVLRLLEQDKISTVIIQLTSLCKLDVSVDQLRQKELVETDPLRNFVIDGVWPSSSSEHHPAKKAYNQWLVSPDLELQSILVKLLLLDYYCQQNQIDLYVFQGYPLSWTKDQQKILGDILDINYNAHDHYHASDHYQYHDHQDHNTIPNIAFQMELAEKISKACGFPLERLHKLTKALEHGNR